MVWRQASTQARTIETRILQVNTSFHVEKIAQNDQDDEDTTHAAMRAVSSHKSSASASPRRNTTPPFMATQYTRSHTTSFQPWRTPASQSHIFTRMEASRTVSEKHVHRQEGTYHKAKVRRGHDGVEASKHAGKNDRDTHIASEHKLPCGENSSK